MNFILGKDDEFEDEPEDELASAGMHVVESDVDDEDVAPVEDEESVEVALDVEDAATEEANENSNEDEIPDGLAELEKLEKDVIAPLTFGDDDEE